MKKFLVPFVLFLISLPPAFLTAEPPTPDQRIANNLATLRSMQPPPRVADLGEPVLLKADPPTIKGGKPRKCGARPSPRWKIATAKRHVQRANIPPQYAYVPAKLDMWGNDTYGDCVTAEEAFAKACYSPEIFLSATVVEKWAQAGGYLDGANLTDVMDSMIKSGFPGTGTQLYNDGPYTSVDYSTESVLQSAISQGPVKIGIDSTALPSGAGNDQGWYATGGKPGQYGNEDHCVALCGYGSATYLYGQLGVPVPAGISGNGYLLYTWSTIGFVDHAWIMSTVEEAWLRSPTTVGVPPLTPPTPVPPTPGPTPGTVTLTQIVATFSDGSTQTLSSAPQISPTMTLQQLFDSMQKKGK